MAGKGKPIGTVFVELDLDGSSYTKKQKDILQGAQYTALDIEKNWRTIGSSSDKMYNAMRQNILNAYNQIANSAKSSAQDIIRAEEAKNAKIKQINEHQYGVHESLLTKMKNNWIATSVAVIAAYRAIGSAIHIGKAALESLDKLDEMSQKVGVGTTTLQVFGHMAKLSGTDIEGVSKALGIMSKNMLTAELKGEDANKALKSLHISATDASGALKASDQIVADVADKFKNMEDGTTKTALAMMLFGKSGKDMIPILNQGSEGIRQTTEEMGRLGILIDEKTVRAAGAFNDRLDTLGLMTKSVAMRVVGDLAPSLDALVKSFIESDASGKILTTTVESIAAGLRILASTAVVAAGVLDLVGTTIGGVIGWTNTLGTEGSSSLDDLGISVEDLGIKTAKTAAIIAAAKVSPFEGLGDKLSSYTNMLDALWKKAGIDVSVRTPKTGTADVSGTSNELESIRKRMADDIAKVTLSEIEQIQRTADEYRKKGATIVEVENWKSAKIAEITQKESDKVLKIQQDANEAIGKHRESATKEYEKLLVDEADFAMTENERAIAKIVKDEQDKLYKINIMLQEETISWEQYEKAKAGITSNAAKARLTNETENAKRIASINYNLIQDIIGMEQTAFNLRMTQIEAEKNKYIADGGDTVHAAKWAADQQTKALIKLGKTGDNISGGMSAAFQQLYLDQLTYGQAGYDMTMGFYSSTSGMFGSMLYDMKGGMSAFSDYWDAFTDSLWKVFSNMISKMLSDWLYAMAAMADSSSGLFGGGGGFSWTSLIPGYGMFSSLSSLFSGGAAAGGAAMGAEMFSAEAIASMVWLHKGGVVGQDGDRGYAPASVFTDAPRYHLGVDEVPAILQKGERVIPKGKGISGNTYVTIPITIEGSVISEHELARRLVPKIKQAVKEGVH